MLAWAYARQVKTETQRRLGAGVLAAGLILIYVYTAIQELRMGIWSLQEGLPLHLCDVSMFVIAYALVSRNALASELGYYWGVAGGINGLLTPELYFNHPDLYFIPFFAWHTLLVIGPLYLIGTTSFRPTHRGIYRALGWTAVLAVFVGFMDWLVQANYMFLCRKPLFGNVAAMMPEWPWYIPLLGGVGLVYFYITYLPFAILQRQDR